MLHRCNRKTFTHKIKVAFGGIRPGKPLLYEADARQLNASACGTSWCIMENYGLRAAL